MTRRPISTELLASLGDSALEKFAGPLSDEEVMAFVLGELVPEQATRVRDLLPFDERALRLALAFGADLEPPAVGSPADLSDEVVAEYRRRLETRITTEQTKESVISADVSEAVAPAIPFPPAAELPRRSSWLGWVALAAAAGIGLIALGLWNQRQTRITLESTIADETLPLLQKVEPAVISRGRGSVPSTEIFVGREGATLYLELPTLAPWNLEIRSLGAARTVKAFRDVEPDSQRRIALHISRRALPVGDYAIFAVQPSAPKRRPIEFPFFVSLDRD